MTISQFFEMAFLVLGMHLSRLKYVYGAALLILLVLVGSLWLVLYRAPNHFPTGAVVTVPSGASVSRTASQLRSSGLISSRLLFKVVMRVIPGVHGVQSGVYAFPKPVGVIAVAWNLSHGISGIPTARVVIPEGTPVARIADLVAAGVPGFDTRLFLKEAKSEEGYLFPDTYFFPGDTTPEAAITRMKANYAVHLAKLAAQIQAFGKPEGDVITMASLLEGEGKSLTEKRMIAGILWHRITLGMPLQVDAPFGYIHGVTGYAPTASDLMSSSPYNTYRHNGLPPTPINNPGDEAILAAVTPASSPYLYYLSGSDGTMHYAKTFAEHIANQKKYLK